MVRYQKKKTRKYKKYKVTVLVSCLIFLVPCGLVMLLYYYPKLTEEKIIQTTLICNTTILPPKHCELFEFIGDGFCDDETNDELCEFDGGDCCDINHDLTLCSECFCHWPKIEQGDCSNYKDKCIVQSFWYIAELGNGVCDDPLNIKDCYFDGGDCCLEESDMTKCDDCTCIQSDLTCVQEELGDGICQDYNNFEICDYDFGDCCTDKHLKSIENPTDCCDCNCKHLLIHMDILW